MTNTIRNIIAGTIAVVVLLAVFFLALFLFKKSTKDFPHPHAGGGCCCCGGGGGGMYSGSGNGLTLGGDKHGNPGTTVIALPGVASNGTPLTGTPDTVDIKVQAGFVSQIMINLNAQQTGFHLILKTGSGPGQPIGQGSNGPMLCDNSAGTTDLHWYLLWMPPTGVPIPPPLPTLMTNNPPGSGYSSYSGTYTYTSSGTPYSATVYITTM